MTITAQNIMSHEFIGLDTKVVHSTNPQIIGLNGRIINETRSMFTIDVNHRVPKSVPKAGSEWEFKIQKDIVIIDGSKIIKRPYDRIVGGIGKEKKAQ